MDTCVALVSAYLRFNGYVAIPEQPVLVGEGRPYRYHTATDVDIIAVRFPNAALVVPREGGPDDDDLHLDIDPMLNLRDATVDVIIGEVKQGRPRLNEALRDPDVLYATMRRIDPGFDEPIHNTIEHLIQHGEARCESGGRSWRIRLVAFGIGEPVREGGQFAVIPLAHVADFLMTCMREHRQVWRDAQFGDPVLDLLHLIDKLDLTIMPTAMLLPQAETAAAPADEAPAPETVVIRPQRKPALGPGHAPVLDLTDESGGAAGAEDLPNRDERREALTLAMSGDDVDTRRQIGRDVA